MSDPRILGTGGAFEQPRTQGFAPNRGWYTIRTFKGTRDAINALMNNLAAQGYEVQADGGMGGMATCRAQLGSTIDGAGDEPVNTWELDVNAVSKDVLETDEFNINAIPAAEIEAIRDGIQNPKAGQSPALTDETAIDIYALMLKGVREKVIYQQILRHTQTVNNNYQVAASNTNIRRILSKSTIGSDEDIPLWIYNSMDDGTSTQDGLIYGWYKEPPRITVVSYLKTQIVQNWQFGLWSTLLYGELL